MAYSGYLLKMKKNNEVFNHNYIAVDTYDVVLNAQDLDSNRNGNGFLLRNVLDHTATTITFSTKGMWSDEFDTMMAKIRRNYASPFVDSTQKNPERKIKLNYFLPETGEYYDGDFYLATPKPRINWIKSTSNKIWYDPMELQFIEY